VANSMVASGLGCRKALVGTGWAISLLLCMNWLRQQPSGPISDKDTFLGLHEQSLAESGDYWELVNEWVWFESWICREWLQGQLGEDLSVKIQGNREYVTRI